MPSTIATALHTAYLCPLTGEGLLVLPPATGDVQLDPAEASLYASDELAMLRELDRLGWELSDDEHGEPWAVVGWTAEGRQVVGLYGRDPIVTLPSIDQQAEALEGLCEAAGVVVLRSSSTPVWEALQPRPEH